MNCIEKDFYQSLSGEIRSNIDEHFERYTHRYPDADFLAFSEGLKTLASRLAQKLTGEYSCIYLLRKGKTVICDLYEQYILNILNLFLEEQGFLTNTYSADSSCRAFFNKTHGKHPQETRVYADGLSGILDTVSMMIYEETNKRAGRFYISGSDAVRRRADDSLLAIVKCRQGTLERSTETPQPLSFQNLAELLEMSEEDYLQALMPYYTEVCLERQNYAEGEGSYMDAEAIVIELEDGTTLEAYIESDADPCDAIPRSIPMLGMMIKAAILQRFKGEK